MPTLVLYLLGTQTPQLRSQVIGWLPTVAGLRELEHLGDGVQDHLLEIILILLHNRLDDLVRLDSLARWQGDLAVKSCV